MARVRTEQREIIPSYVKQKILNDCGHICAHCGKYLVYGDNFTLEHVIPLNKGGKNDESNYVALCETCNKAKSDDVVEPKEYYKCLPKGKVEELQSMFESYCKNVDWLGYDNVFRTDQFNLMAPIPVYKGSVVVNVPTTYRVEKMRVEEFLDFSILYRARLCTEDKDLVPDTEEDAYLPYYRVTHGGKLVMVISPYITGVPEKGSEEDVNVMFIDSFVNPEIKVNNTTTIAMLYNIFQALKAEAQKTFWRKGLVTTMNYSIRSPGSDKLCVATLEAMDSELAEPHRIMRRYDNPNNTGSCIVTLEGYLAQGSYNDLRNMVKGGKDMSISELRHTISLKDTQLPIDLRLKAAKEIKEPEHKEKVKKKDKKASKKKKHR